MQFYDASTRSCAKLTSDGWIAADSSRPEDHDLATLLNGSIEDLMTRTPPVKTYVSSGPPSIDYKGLL
jgi:hypothetical protein